MSKSNHLLLKWIFIGCFLASLAFNILLTFEHGILNHVKSTLSCVSKKEDTNPKQSSFDESTDQQIAYYLKDSTVLKLDPVSFSESKEIPEKMIISPGVYNFFGKNYSLLHEGLYRFVVPGKFNLQRIVYQNNPEALLSAICWIVSHGNSDDSKTVSALTEKALHSKLFITCGIVSKWAKKLLSSNGLKSRIVGGITVDKWNDYDNGHILLEVWWPKWSKWVVFDLDNNCFFLPLQSTIPLSIIELSPLVKGKTYRRKSLANDIRLDISGFRSEKKYEYSFISEGINADIESWYERVLMVPFIFDEKQRVFIFMDSISKTRVESYSGNYKYLAKDEFMKKYYGTK